MTPVGPVQARPSGVEKPAVAVEADGTEFFRLKRAFARTCHDDWLVLSGTNGLVEPDERVEGSGTTFSAMEPAGRVR